MTGSFEYSNVKYLPKQSSTYAATAVGKLRTPQPLIFAVASSLFISPKKCTKYSHILWNSRAQVPSQSLFEFCVLWNGSVLSPNQNHMLHKTSSGSALSFSPFWRVIANWLGLLLYLKAYHRPVESVCLLRFASWAEKTGPALETSFLLASRIT